MDVALAIDEEAEPVGRVSILEGGYDEKGNAIVAGYATETILASIQPATGSVLRNLPEGARTDVSFVGWSRSPVAVGDLINYGDQVLAVTQVWPWPRDGFNKFALAERQL